MKVFPSLEQVVRRKSCASRAPIPGSPCSTAIHHRRSPEPSSSSSCWTGCGTKCSRPSSRKRPGLRPGRRTGRRGWRPQRRCTRRSWPAKRAAWQPPGTYRALLPAAWSGCSSTRSDGRNPRSYRSSADGKSPLRGSEGLPAGLSGREKVRKPRIMVSHCRYYS